MAVTSTATATWLGKLKDGKGQFAAASGAFRGDYTFATRFEGKAGTTPEELIAAAHAACFSMALSGVLERAGTPSTSLTTNASCTIDSVGGASKITAIRLEVRGKVPGADATGFRKAAETAGENCPVSVALKGNVSLDVVATLEQ